MPYVDYVPDGIRASMVENPPQRSVPEPYEDPVEQFDLRVKGYPMVAAYRCSSGYTCGVPLLGGRCHLVIVRRVGGYGVGQCLLPSSYRCRASDSLYCAVSLPKLGSTILQWESFPRVVESA